MKKALLFLALSAPTWAALPPLSPAVRAQMAEQVVTVTVESVERKEVPGKAAGKDWLSTATVRVDAVSKGPAKKGHFLTVHFRKISTRPQGWVGPVGQNHALVKGEHCTLFLSGKDNELLEPNGWEPVKP